MPEWLKILLSALAGMLAGFAADPIRELVSKRVKVFRLKRALGFDWLMAKACCAVVKHELAPKDRFWQFGLFPAFTHHWQHDPEIFYTDMDLQIVRLQIQAVQILQDAVQSGRTPIEEAEPQLLAALDEIQKYILKPPKTWADRVKTSFIAKFY